MSDQKTKEYHERTKRWANTTSSQLSFHNNLFLTLNIAFLSLAYNEEKLQNTTFSSSSVDWSLSLYSASLCFVVLSILAGLIVSFSRLYDFRITKAINLTRKRVYKYSQKMLSEGTPEKLSLGKRTHLMFKVIAKDDYPRITIEQCKNLEKAEQKAELNENFKQLRTISYNLGHSTWIGIKWQTGLFFLAIVLYVVSIFI